MTVTTATRFYDFAERLTWSEGFLNDGIAAILQERIPECYAVEKAQAADDKSGTDYWAYRNYNLRPLSIDVKVREQDYRAHPDPTKRADDLALETWSVIYTKIGWTRDTQKHTDFVLWYWTDTGRFFLASFPALCRTFIQYWQTWAHTYRTSIQQSNGWKSECVFVPRKVVIDRMNAWASGTVRSNP